MITVDKFRHASIVAIVTFIFSAGLAAFGSPSSQGLDHVCNDIEQRVQFLESVKMMQEKAFDKLRVGSNIEFLIEETDDDGTKKYAEQWHVEKINRPEKEAFVRVTRYSPLGSQKFVKKEKIKLVGIPKIIDRTPKECNFTYIFAHSFKDSEYTSGTVKEKSLFREQFSFGTANYWEKVAVVPFGIVESLQTMNKPSGDLQYRKHTKVTSYQF